MKLEAEYIVFLIAFIINNCIDSKIFQGHWKVARICPISSKNLPESKCQHQKLTSDRYLHCQFHPKYLNE